MTTDDDIQTWLEQRRVNVTEGPGPRLIGLDSAIAAVDAAVARIREARPGDPPVPRGWLISGQPGTGKSALAAHAVRAAGPDIPAYDLSVPWLTPERLSRALAHLADRPPSLVLMAEIDAWGSSREWADPGSRQLLFAALEALDSMGRQREATTGFCAIATTTRVANLDHALRRPGRFDLHIVCPLPGRRHRIELLGHHLERWAAGDLDLGPLADQTAGWSPAQLKAAAEDSIGRAWVRGGRGTPVTQIDVLASIRQRGQLARDDDEEPEVVARRLHVAAVHEAGHVAVSRWLGLPLRAVQLRTTGDGWTAAGREDVPADEHQLRAAIIVAFGGIAAERLILGAAGTGGADDVEQATRIAVNLVEAGLDDDFPPINRGAFGSRAPRTIDEPLGDHVLEVLTRARQRAESIVLLQCDAIERFAARLVETPVLSGDALHHAIREAGFGASTANGQETDPWIFAPSSAVAPTGASTTSATSPSAASMTMTHRRA